MLIEFETLDSEDIRKIMDNEWDIEDKRSRLKKADELHKKGLPVPPPPPSEEKSSKSAISAEGFSS